MIVTLINLMHESSLCGDPVVPRWAASVSVERARQDCTRQAIISYRMAWRLMARNSKRPRRRLSYQGGKHPKRFLTPAVI